MSKKIIALFGGGPACIIAALELSAEYEVHLYEKGKSIGRKFLVAGNGGFNITNAVIGENLYNVYSKSDALRKALVDFDSKAVRKWLDDLGINTYVGSSNRVFPVDGIKPAEVLKVLKNKLEEQKVNIHTNCTFIGFTKDNLPIVEDKEGKEEIIAAYHYVFGLGGGSWKITGANSEWLSLFEAIGVEISPFQASNCGVNVAWEKSFRDRFEGSPLKNISLHIGEFQKKGEAVITKYGLEGNALYPLVPIIRNHLKKNGKAQLFVDLKPNNSIEELKRKSKKNMLPKNYAYAFNLNKMEFNLVKNTLSKSEFFDPFKFAEQLKKVPVSINDLRPVEEAISTVGGIDMGAVDSNFTLKKDANISVVGEMLNWDAPTGGFLLQACFAIGKKAATAINEKTGAIL